MSAQSMGPVDFFGLDGDVPSCGSSVGPAELPVRPGARDATNAGLPPSYSRSTAWAASLAPAYLLEHSLYVSVAARCLKPKDLPAAGVCTAHPPHGVQIKEPV